MPGLVLGGMLFWQTALKPTQTTASIEEESNDNLGFALVGFAIDGFPDPAGGFHVGGSLGAATVGIADYEKDEVSGDPSQGAGLAVWVGYDFWLAEQWSIGGKLQLIGARTTGNENVGAELIERNDDITSISLSVTGLYH